MQRQTKVIATLGPSVASEEGVRSLIDAGMDVARINFSHGDQDVHRNTFRMVRKAADEAGRTVAVMQDIQGPKLRVGKFTGGEIGLLKDTEIELSPDTKEGNSSRIPIGYGALLEDVSPGDRVILADGMVSCEVTGRTDDALVARVLNGGVLTDQKGVAFPDSNLSVANITPKDHEDLELGRELGVDYVAASFVRSAADVEAVADLAGDAPIIAKIELAQALTNLDDILEVSFGVMVARGDLGVQLPLERIPLIQADILKRANAAGRISVTATEMLESMTHNPRPTRAEVTDVAHAVMGGTDAVMLSGETAIGEYPAQTVATMAKICLTVEEGTLGGELPIPFVGERTTWHRRSPKPRPRSRKTSAPIPSWLSPKPGARPGSSPNIARVNVLSLSRPTMPPDDVWPSISVSSPTNSSGGTTPTTRLRLPGRFSPRKGLPIGENGW